MKETFTSINEKLFLSKCATSTIILGVIGADCHAVGNKIIEYVLTREGFQVINLGVMVSQDEFIDAAIETGADAILVSSIYGHGEIDCLGFRGRCIERGLENIVLYVGGNLVIGKRAFEEIETLFIEMGFDKVFSPKVDLLDVSKFLKADILSNSAPSEFKHHFSVNTHSKSTALAA